MLPDFVTTIALIAQSDVLLGIHEMQGTASVSLILFFFLGSNKSLIQNAQRLIKKSVDNHMNQWPCASQELLQGSSLRISQKPRQQSALLRKKKHSHRYIDNALIISGIKAIFLKILDS